MEGIDRLICSSDTCHYVFWDNPVPVVAALVEYDGQYIIARNKEWPKNIFSVITGFLERNESPEQGALREVEEELNLTGNIVRHIGNYSFSEQNQIILCYEVQATGVIEKNHELVELKLLSETELIYYDFKPLYITEKIILDWGSSILYEE